MNRVEWMKEICHLWSRGGLISASLPVGDGWYWNISLQNVEMYGNIVRFDVLAPSAELLYMFSRVVWEFVCACAVSLELMLLPHF